MAFRRKMQKNQHVGSDTNDRKKNKYKIYKLNTNDRQMRTNTILKKEPDTHYECPVCGIEFDCAMFSLRTERETHACMKQ